MLHALWVLILVYVLGILPVRAADWPQFRGPHADGISRETGINKAWGEIPPPLRWQVPMSDKGYAGPSVANGKVFIIDHEGSDDIVRALDLLTGKEVWRYSYEDSARANYGFARSTPLIAGGKVYTLSRLGVANCLDEASGRLIWTRHIVTEFGGRLPTWQLSMSPFLDGDKLILHPGGATASIVALHKDTGKTLWTATGAGCELPGYAAPVLAVIEGVRQYVISTGTTIIGIKDTDGSLLWSMPWQNQRRVNSAAPLVIGDSVFVTSGYGRGCMLFDIKDGEATMRWENKAIQAHFNSAVLLDGFIYGTGDPGMLVCLDPATGDVKWSQRGFEKGGLVAVDGVLIVLTGHTGDVVMVKITPEAYVELGRFTPLGGQSWSPPIVAQGKLIVRNTTALACFDLR